MASGLSRGKGGWEIRGWNFMFELSFVNKGWKLILLHKTNFVLFIYVILKKFFFQTIFLL